MDTSGLRARSLLVTSVTCAAALVFRADTDRGQVGATDLRHRLAPAVAFLTREVPAWHAVNGCYSCHNNGDAVRALVAASAAGFDVSESLADTVSFLATPVGWSENSRGGPLDDQALARVQFASALADAVGRRMAPAAALVEAAGFVAADQHEDGSWHLDPSNSLGSPATYGRALATWSARRTLVESASPAFAGHIRRADRWLREVPVRVTPDAAAVMLGLGTADDPPAGAQRTRALAFLLDTQGPDGGWGPYPNVRAEAFDTAMAVIALASQPPADRIAAAIARGRAWLLSTMLADGSWLETTRPPGQSSYAQRISTTGWAVIALLQ